LDLDQERHIRSAVQPADRQPLDLHVPGHHRRRRAERHLRRRLHGARGRPELRPVLHLHGHLHLLDAAARPGRELRLSDHRLGAMEGPTPVSALIHAATMVTAGVYLVGRMHPIYDVAVYAHGAVAIVGAVTALFAATIAIVQTDIKRVLAYSTMSQIGYMFLA